MMIAKERRSGIVVIWAEKGLINHVTTDFKIMKRLVDEEIPIKAYPGYIETPKLSPMTSLVPDKTKTDLGPNG